MDFCVYTHKRVGTVYIVIVHKISVEDMLIRNALRVSDLRERILVFIKLLDNNCSVPKTNLSETLKYTHYEFYIILFLFVDVLV